MSRIADSVGRVLSGRYRLTRPLGVGASAHVFVAEDVQLRRRVAIKILHPALAADAAFGRRFQAEARVVAALRHPNILRVYDWGEDDGSPYLVMELLEGGSLRAMLDKGVLLTPAQAAAIGADAARALDYAHRRGLVHRDIKPANLIFDDEGRITVADFGLARALAEASWTEPAGAVVGTARYAAPEQVRGHVLDNRADVYSLALVLVEAITGSVPFTADTTLGTLMARVEHPLESPKDTGPLAPVLEAAGTIDPQARMDAAAFARALDSVAARLPLPDALQLSRPSAEAEAERDRYPTQLVGAPKLFDAAAVERTADSKRARGRSKPASNGHGADDSHIPTWDELIGESAKRVEATDLDNEVVADLPAELDGLDDLGAAHEPSDRPSDGPSDGPSEGVARVPISDGTTDIPVVRYRRRRVVAALIAAALLVAAAVGILLLVNSSTPSHPVPNLVNDSVSKAQQALQPLHFKFAVTERPYSNTVPAGEVISQTPATGNLTEGSTVKVLLSAGPHPVAVPSMVGKTQPVAQSLLNRSHLKLGRVTPQSSRTIPEGVVISEQPLAGAQLTPGTPVSLVVSSGKPKVPVPPLGGSAGQSFASAQSALSAVGLSSVQQQVYSDYVPKGQVISSFPTQGVQVTVGSVVTVAISLGPHLAPVPNVGGLSVQAASQLLGNYGFQVSGVTGNPTAKVRTTSPPAGSVEHYGWPVQIITG